MRVKYLWHKEEVNKYPYYFLLLYAVTFMTSAVYNTFIPVYLNHKGFNQAAIGTLLAIGPLIAIIAYPIWGIACDRATSKNKILKTLILASASVVVLYPLSSNFFYLFAVIATFTFFQSSINPICDSITLEHLESTRWKFGPIRLAGTLGFALMSVIAGIIAKHNIEKIFILYAAIAMLAFFAIFRLPLIKGHQSDGNKISIWRLFKNRELVILIAFNFIIQITFGFYYSFFPIYYKQLGADSALLGIAMLITSTSEIPFLLFANKILDKLGIKFTLVASALIISLRWMLMHFVTDLNILLLVNATHGLSFIVFSFCLATYISKNVPKELRASGQTMNALLCMGFARIIGSALGGALSDIIGIKQVFLYTSFIDLTAAIAFGAVFLFQLRSQYVFQNRQS
jgi:MFS transporter, PPP family, 3-phenylpropionic acid transporter